MRRKTLGFVCVVLLVLAVISLVTAASLQDRRAGDTSTALADDDLVPEVNAYWAAALEGDTEGVKKHLVRTPLSFIQNCKVADVPAAKDAPPAQTNPGERVVSATGLSGNIIDEQWGSLNAFTAAIRQNGYVLRKVIVEKRSDEDAFVHVSYRTAAEPYLGFGLLLHKDEGRWRIFATANKTELASMCSNFAEGNK